ncbi:glycosyltransferase [Paenibacillus sp. Marseille-Q4541]|uniref:glycosyltransferase n=1 Tax=Paenibacillus sp. Marseille-Q4541 TaxID=2831522 RepID=UPI001BA4CDB5|nr:glycosyltransferase [Paenibacillus sp. Marseille-Q4541]
MNTHPLVTVVIPFYNCPFVSQAISSALSQTYPMVEIIVVDDGSTEHVEQIHPYLPYIHYLGKENGGTATALNHGIKHASGEYIVWLSSDDILYPEKIAKQVQLMMDQRVSISHTNFNYINEHSSLTQYRAGASPMTRLEMLRIFILGNPVNGCTVMFHKSLIQAIGMFDEALPYTHDYDLWYRVLLADYSFAYLAEPLTAYRRHQGMGSVKHAEAITHEIRYTQNRYADQLRHMIQMLER